jgi:DNA-binding protein H-NS
MPTARATWLVPSGLAVQDDAMATDAFERSSSHPEVFHVWQDSEVLANNVHTTMQSEPAKLRAAQPRRLQFLYAGSNHALLAWGGQYLQGRAVAWLKQFLKS